ncbi:MAG: SMC-Scp complex subunit ScpB [Dehalococcoidia bacterium]|jgi:segregation and condensation protein B|nr:SMC-Scp complex subunit ScpB [Dehalococcoidia bacterium]
MPPESPPENPSDDTSPPNAIPIDGAHVDEPFADEPSEHVEPADEPQPDDSQPDDRPSDAPDAPSAEQLPSVLEALLFVSEDPVSPGSLARALGVRRRQVDRALDTLSAGLAERGVRLQIGPDGAQIVTSPGSSTWVQYYLGIESQRRLSNAALETLAIVAYQQPVTRSTIESIRGVNSDGAVSTLRARGLLDEVGRAPGPGRAMLLATTQRFLEHFGLERPQDLPALPDLPDLAPPPPDAPPPLEGIDTGAAGDDHQPGERDETTAGE